MAGIEAASFLRYGYPHVAAGANRKRARDAGLSDYRVRT